jgi:hypothetical protein
MFLAWRKPITARISQLTGLSVTGHIISDCGDKNKHKVISYVMVYKAVSHVMLPHMCNLVIVPTLVA